MLKNLPFQLVLCIAAGLLLGDYLPLTTVSLFYTMSVFIKDMLMWLLPLIVFSYITAAMLSFEQRAPILIVLSLVLVIASNALTVLTSYVVGSVTLPWIVSGSLHALSATQSDVSPLWSLPIKPFITADRAMMAAVIVGLIGSFAVTAPLKKAAFKLRDFSTHLLKVGFIPVLPLYVLGFVLKLDRDGSLGLLLQQYSGVFLLSCGIISIYIAFMYLIAADFNLARACGFMREMLPAGLTGFSTMSSAASMPVTLEATEKNLGSREYADFIIPTTVNIHLIGDGLNIALTGLALVLLTGLPYPSFEQYLWFVLYYCLAKFSCAGVPGGGVIVILPVIQQYLGLNPETTSLLATIYILQDPILTGSNVMGNGAFALLTHKVMKRFI